MSNSKMVHGAIILVAIFAGAVLLFGGSDIGGMAVASQNANADSGTPKLVIYKSASCGCCTGYAEYLRRMGFNVEVVVREDVDAIKNKYGIPHDKRSCHTTVAGNYFIEGHVPVEAINKLFSERPDIKGISLPRMPSGSPGMPGAKRGTWVIYAFTEGGIEEFMRM